MRDAFFCRTSWVDRRAPPRSPDLTPPDFSSGCVRDKIFHNPTNTMDELKLRITKAISAIESQILRRVFRNMQKRVSACLRKQGGHFEYVI